MGFPDDTYSKNNLVDKTDGSTPEQFLDAAFAGNWDDTIDELSTNLRRGVFATVQNDTGSILAKGALVKISGHDGTNPEVALAQADSSNNFADGVIFADIAIGGTGIIVQRFGITGLDTSAFLAQDEIFLDASTPGDFTKTAPANRQRVGRVTVVDGSTGEVEFDIERDSSSTSPADDITLEDTGTVLQIKDDGVDSDQLAFGAVDSDAILTDAVTNDKLADNHKEVRVVKMVDEVKANDASPADDFELFVSFGAGETWELEIGMYVNVAGTAPGFQYNLNYDGTVTDVRTVSLDYGEGASNFDDDSQNGIDSAFNVTRNYPISGGGVGEKFIMHKVSVTPNTLGTLAVQWAQNTSNATSTTMRRGSYLAARRVA